MILFHIISLCDQFDIPRLINPKKEINACAIIQYLLFSYCIGFSDATLTRRVKRCITSCLTAALAHRMRTWQDVLAYKSRRSTKGASCFAPKVNRPFSGLGPQSLRESGQTPIYSGTGISFWLRYWHALFKPAKAITLRYAVIFAIHFGHYHLHNMHLRPDRSPAESYVRQMTTNDDGCIVILSCPLYFHDAIMRQSLERPLECQLAQTIHSFIVAINLLIINCQIFIFTQNKWQFYINNGTC